jgi:hypothetical protein
MRRLLFAFTLLQLSFTAIGQANRSIDISLLTRYDKHADFTTRFGNRSYTNDIKLWGVSYGLNFNYLYPIIKGLKLSAGAGYYRLGINKIKGTTPWSRDVSSRSIDYTHPLGIDPNFYTDKYHYNTFSLAAGLNYEHRLSDKATLTISADYTYLYTFSQSYRITYDQSKYKTTYAKSLGFGVNGYVGLLRKISNDQYYVNPKIILPVYQQLKGDKIFLENEDVRMNKWFNGAGLSMTFGKYL